MSFQTGLSGLNAASKNLDVIGNNIANANTTGAKVSRAEFAEIIASSSGAGAAASAGIGVDIAAVSQQFTQGNITVTGNDLDVAINGGGFFQLTLTNGESAYTRAGIFKLDKAGNIVTNTGANLMGYPTDPVTGKASSRTLEPLKLPTTTPIPAKSTTSITTEFNLDARAPVWDQVIPNTPLTTSGTSFTAYDSQGNAIETKIYMRKTATDTWEVFTDPVTPQNPTPATLVVAATLTFDTTGKLIPLTTPVTIPLTSTNPNIGTFTATLDISKASQYATAFSVSDLNQNGYPPGNFTGLKISENGYITARYSNGQSQTAGQFAVVDFRNSQGLQPTGGGNWAETPASGQPISGAPGEGNFGVLRAGALEDSNVDLTAELVNMMSAQRAYQANVQTIKTQDQALSALTNLR